MIVYLHGFNSSPNSHKAGVLARRLAESGCADELRVPALSHWPARAIAQAIEIIESARVPLCLAGSSLGGYYATWLAERYGLPAVLINPAVKPYRLLAFYLGTQHNPYTGEVYQLTDEHLAQLRELEVVRPSEPGRYLVLLQTGDEVLDYREALGLYGAAQCRVQEGGDHAYQGFESVVDDLLDFCNSHARAIAPADG